MNRSSIAAVSACLTVLLFLAAAPFALSQETLYDHQWSGVESTYDTDAVTPVLTISGSIHPGVYNFNYTPFDSTGGSYTASGATTSWGGTITVGSDGHTITSTLDAGSLTAYGLNSSISEQGWQAVSLTGTGGSYTVTGQYQDYYVIQSVTSDVAATAYTSNWDINTGGAGTENTYYFPWSLKSNVSQQHTIELYVDGNLVTAETIQSAKQGGTASTQSGTATFLTYGFSDDYQWYVDGSPSTASNSNGTLTSGAPGSTQTEPLFSMSWTTDLAPTPTPQPGNPSTVPTPTPGGPTATPITAPVLPPSNSGNITVQTGTGSSSAPDTYVNNGGTTITGGTSGATNQDIYNDVKEADVDGGNTTPTGGYASVSSGSFTDNLSGSLAVRGHLDDLQGLADSGTSDISNTLSSTFYGSMASTVSTISLPSGIGSSMTFSLGTPSIDGVAIPLMLDFTPFSSVVALVRSVLLVLLTWGYVVASVRLVRKFLI